MVKILKITNFNYNDSFHSLYKNKRRSPAKNKIYFTFFSIQYFFFINRYFSFTISLLILETSLSLFIFSNKEIVFSHSYHIQMVSGCFHFYQQEKNEKPLIAYNDYLKVRLMLFVRINCAIGNYILKIFISFEK